MIWFSAPSTKIHKFLNFINDCWSFIDNPDSGISVSRQKKDSIPCAIMTVCKYWNNMAFTYSTYMSFLLEPKP